jgi:hypothetical protein
MPKSKNSPKNVLIVPKNPKKLAKVAKLDQFNSPTASKGHAFFLFQLCHHNSHYDM